MADNAPFSIARPPYPNLVVQGFNQRIKRHIVKITLAAGAPTVVAASSSPGVTASTPGNGRVAVVFPAGGTGATGWVSALLGLPNGTTDMNLSFRSDTVNFATGALELQTVTTTTLTNATGTIDVAIDVLEPVVT